MINLLKPGTSKPKKARSRIDACVSLGIFFLFLLLISGCTKSVSDPARLTEVAIRFEITKIALETIYPDQGVISGFPSPTQSAPVAIIPMEPSPTVTPLPTREPYELQPIPTTTPDPEKAMADLIRNTFPVDWIGTDVTATPIPEEPAQPVPVVTQEFPDLALVEKERILYLTQNGDTLEAIANRFGTVVGRISAIGPVRPDGFLEPNISLFIPPKTRETLSGVKIIPDEYIVYSRTATDYNIAQEIINANGYLAQYVETTARGKASGSEIISWIAHDYSINPIVLLALLEYKSHWVYSYPVTAAEVDYPMGWVDISRKGLYKQMSWAAGILSKGYYGWREGAIDEIPFYKYPKPDGPIYFEPSLNAGSVAIQYLFSQIYAWNEIDPAIYGENGFYAVFTALFGNVWENYSPDPYGLNGRLQQIELILPFSPSEKWALTGGPHLSWNTGSPFGALDFAPPSAEQGCVVSNLWVRASAAGVVVRIGDGLVVVDMDGDGFEETGWVMIYLHVATRDRVPVGTVLAAGDRIGHPSCEGGQATGTHVHLARKYNGEWIAANGPLPFTLSGWTAFLGEKAYLGGMQRGSELVLANSYGSQESLIYH